MDDLFQLTRKRTFKPSTIQKWFALISFLQVKCVVKALGMIVS